MILLVAGLMACSDEGPSKLPLEERFVDAFPTVIREPGVIVASDGVVVVARESGLLRGYRRLARGDWQRDEGFGQPAGRPWSPFMRAGPAMAMSGDTLAFVAAEGIRFLRDSEGGWIDEGIAAYLPETLALSGDTLLAAESGQAMIEVYQRSQGSWSWVTDIVLDEPLASKAHVAISGDTVAATLASGEIGIYRRVSGLWTWQQNVAGGSALRLDGDHLMVGGADGVDFYEAVRGEWQPRNSFSFDPRCFEHPSLGGDGVHMRDGLAVQSCFQNPEVEGTKVFVWSGSDWNQVATLPATSLPDPASVAVDAETIVLGGTSIRIYE